jgi:hypothetical protein
MPWIDPTPWSELLARTLAGYGEELLRQVAARLVKPRNQWPAEELIARGVETIGNAAVVDRRLKDLGPAEGKLLALIGHSGQPRWRVVHLLEMLAALGHAEGLEPVLQLFQAGLLYPIGIEPPPRLKNFEQWLGQAAATDFEVFAHPQVTGRALGEDLGFPTLPGEAGQVSGPHETDGLEWPMRLAVLWQQTARFPLRRTQSEGYFKRDLDRLRADPLLISPPADNLADLPDPGLLAAGLGVALGVLRDEDGELRIGTLPSAWTGGLATTLASVWTVLPQLHSWDPRAGWRGGAPTGTNPYPSAYLLALLLLAAQPEGSWHMPEAIEGWVTAHHPAWRTVAGPAEPPEEDTGLGVWLLGFAYQVRLVQAARSPAGNWVIAISPMGRWLLGMGPEPATPPKFARTLLVQPNLEILAYRQGLTPELITSLSRFAAWKSLGAACTLQLEPESVYRALETGETYDSILQTLESHGMKPTPTPVVESLKTWANKRERIGVYPGAVLLEFTNPEHLNEALARGLPAVRLSDKLAVVAREQDVNYHLFRLTGTRDYSLPPEKCVEVESDGVTLTVDLSRSDLLLETEVQRFAESFAGATGSGARGDRESVNGRRQYQLTPRSLTAGRDSGLTLLNLESWFVQRCGQALSPAARLLWSGGEIPPLEVRRLQILNVPTPELADGLLQWPATRALIADRLGPTALVVPEEHIEELRQRLQTAGVKLQSKDSI